MVMALGRHLVASCAGKLASVTAALVYISNRRYGTVELTSVKAEVPAGWAWGRRLSINGRRWLVWAHMAALNGISIGGR